jgi:glycerol kinase
MHQISLQYWLTEDVDTLNDAMEIGDTLFGTIASWII